MGATPSGSGPITSYPKPLDTRVLLTVAPAVARAAVESGVARVELGSHQAYAARLEARLGPEREIMGKIIIRAQHNPKRIVLPEGNHPVILRAAHQAAREGICRPLLLGDENEIISLAGKLQIPLDGIEIENHLESPHLEEFTKTLFQLRCRKGWSLAETQLQLKDRHIFGAMMVHEGLVDGQVHGIGRSYPDAIRPVLRVIPRRKGVKKVSGVYLMIFKNQSLFFADPTVNITPSSENLAEIAILTAEMARFFDVVPRIAMISFSDFGTAVHPDAQRVKAAVAIARERAPELMIDGEMQADTAVVGEILARDYPFSQLDGPANVLIFPELATANVAYKLLSRLGGAKAVGPLLMGISKPFNVLHRDADMENVLHVIAITVAQAQEMEGS